MTISIAVVQILTKKLNDRIIFADDFELGEGDENIDLEVIEINSKREKKMFLLYEDENVDGSDLPQLIDFEATRAVNCEIFKKNFELRCVADFYTG